MATTKTRTTAADIAAAVKLGTLDPSTIIPTAAEIRTVYMPSPNDGPVVAAAPMVPTDAHVCTRIGCTHGATHSGPTQPDRQVKLECPKCGAVARMTQRALAKSGGILCASDGGAFNVATRRTYSRKAVA